MQKKRIIFYFLFGPFWDPNRKSVEKIKFFFISFALVLVSIVVVVDYSFHHSSPSKTTAKAWW